MDVGEVFVGPGVVVAAGERLTVIDSQRQIHGTARPGGKLQSRERIAAAGDDRHHGPVAAAEDAQKRFFIDRAGPGRIARMRVDPDPSELLGSQAAIDLLIEELGDCCVVKGNGDHRAALADEHEVFDQQQVIGGGDPEAADFGLTEITQEQQLGPRGRPEAERGTE